MVHRAIEEATERFTQSQNIRTEEKSAVLQAAQLVSSPAGHALRSERPSGTIDTIKLHGWETGCAHALFAGSDVTSSLIL